LIVEVALAVQRFFLAVAKGRIEYQHHGAQLTNRQLAQLTNRQLAVVNPAAVTAMNLIPAEKPVSINASSI
jgi:hypothetical protein